MSITTFCRRAVAVIASAVVLAVGVALPALAHVTINPRTAEKGGYAKLAFRVPNERDDASTTKLEVRFPTDHPLSHVSIKPVPGWDAKLTRGELPKPVVDDYGETVTESVLKITWSGGKIEPGQFQEFEISVGPLPKNADRLVFPAIQTYSSGEVVEWTDEPAADGTEPERPAPVLTLVDAAEDADEAHPGAASASPAAPSVTPVEAASPAQADDSDGIARVLGVAGVVVGLIGIDVGAVGLRRARG